MSIFDRLFSSNKKRKKFGNKEQQEAAADYDVYLTACAIGAKIKVIKEARNLKNLGLMEAKNLVESAPVIIASALSKDAALNIKLKFENAGAEIEIKPSEKTEEKS